MLATDTVLLGVFFSRTPRLDLLVFVVLFSVISMAPRVVAGIETSCSKDQRIEVHATKGMLQADNQKPTTMIRSTANGRSYDSNCYSFPQRYAAAYEAELAHFVEAILDGAPLKVRWPDVGEVLLFGRGRGGGRNWWLVAVAAN